MEAAPAQQPRLWKEVRFLVSAAMTIFVFTIVIGILNGTDLIDFDQRRILGHVHGGTLGWVTLSVIAASWWLFGEGEPLSEGERRWARWLSIAAVVAFVSFIAAFTTTYGVWRAIFGIIAALVIAGCLAWVVVRIPKTVLGVPQWGFLAGLATSVLGAVFGILWALKVATGDNWLSSDAEGAHPATMVLGFLVPVGLAMAEWAFFFPVPPKATRLGIIQMALPFAGGVLLTVAVLLGIEALQPVAFLLQMVGMGIFVKRLWPQLRHLNWLEATPGRHGAFAFISLVFVNVGAQVLIGKYEGDFDLIPFHQLLALDHAQFVGLMTHAVFAMLMAATVGPRGKRVDQVIFVLTAFGIAAFVVGLMGDWTIAKRVATPILGAGLLVALATYALRLYAPGKLGAVRGKEVEPSVDRRLPGVGARGG